MRFASIAPSELQLAPVQLFGKDWMLLTAGSAENHNTMTVSWGGLGVLWGMPVATVYVRPERHTYSFMNENGLFSLCAFDESRREALVLAGTKSGRDADKDALCGLTPVRSAQGGIYYAEARLALVCKKIYTQDFDRGRFLDERVDKIYENAQLHRIFIGEIVEALIKED